MKLGVPSLFDNTTIVVVSEFTLDDFRSISFLIENENDQQLESFLTSKIDTKCNGIDKFNALLNARIKFVNELIILNNGKSDVKININLWKNKLINDCKDVKTTICDGEYSICVDYPIGFYHDSFEKFLVNSIYTIEYKRTTMDISLLSYSDKSKVIDKLPLSLMSKVKDYIYNNMSSDIILMNSMANLPDIKINFLDYSIFDIIKSLYNYYTYDGIIETIFFLSKRISDVSYLNSRTPRDLDLLIDLYSNEVEKINQDTKSNI